MAENREEEIKASGGLGRKLGRGLGCQRTYRTTHSGGVFTGVTRWSGEWSVRARLGSESSPGAGVRDSETELGGVDMSRRGKVE